MGVNTIYLDPSMFTNKELLKYADITTVWNGTSSLEFAAQGMKTLVMDEWGHKDYPIGFYECKSKLDYKNMLLHPDKLIENPILQDKAIMFLNYMGSNWVCYKNELSTTSTLNFGQFDSKINSDKVDEFLNGKYKDFVPFFDRCVYQQYVHQKDELLL
jgi:hypothetical protein